VQTQRFIAYGLPSLTNLVGCASSGPTNALQGCARDGTSRVQLWGSNFGQNVQVLVGGELCQSPTSTDNHVECTLPPGTALLVQIIVAQTTGGLYSPSASDFSVSYQYVFVVGFVQLYLINQHL
jgi:hypothetical protein